MQNTITCCSGKHIRINCVTTQNSVLNSVFHTVATYGEGGMGSEKYIQGASTLNVLLKITQENVKNVNI